MNTATTVADDFPVELDRSFCIARIGPKDSKPEIIVRKLLKMGYCFRLHAKELPGRSDIVFHLRKKAIFAHGRFWHRHSGCPKATNPKTRTQFWQFNFAANQARVMRVQDELIEIGWEHLVIWERETTDQAERENRLISYLG
ncbi:MAG: very short patch repair endonuclease [Rhodobacteraceae bacterium]|nr:very short patch repair endonuclease [Paracoccaceae bacterium]